MVELSLNTSTGLLLDISMICCNDGINSVVIDVTRRCCASLTRRPMRKAQFDHASSNKIRSPSSALRCLGE